MYAIKNHSKEFIEFLLNDPRIDINWQDIFKFNYSIMFLI